MTILHVDPTYELAKQELSKLEINYENQNQRDKAADLFRTLLESDRDCEKAKVELVNLGLAEIKEGKYRRA
jgi:hypothetical protein